MLLAVASLLRRRAQSSAPGFDPVLFRLLGFADSVLFDVDEHFWSSSLSLLLVGLMIFSSVSSQIHKHTSVEILSLTHI